MLRAAAAADYNLPADYNLLYGQHQILVPTPDINILGIKYIRYHQIAKYIRYHSKIYQLFQVSDDI